MTGPPLVGRRRPHDALAALAGGQVIAVPGDGGYLLAARHDHHDAVSRLRRLGPNPTESGPLPVLVGHREQAMALASVWTKETATLTDRMWPGPLTVIVPAALHREGDPGVNLISMPATRALRALCRASAPLAVCALRRTDGTPIVDPAEVEIRCVGTDVALIIDGGVCRSAGPTVVDCTVSPPTVHHVGALPESYVDAALMMGNRRRRFFSRRTRPDSPTR